MVAFVAPRHCSRSREGARIRNVERATQLAGVGKLVVLTLTQEKRTPQATDQIVMVETEAVMSATNVSQNTKENTIEPQNTEDHKRLWG